ncbi:MAG TPA: class I SAM-dependent methyltransferase [Acidobacteriaceae bacterium]|nr:class I SAM-dependent methyltransferase [Acidobacteriaceae bacterium]
MHLREHWESVHISKSPEQTSWYQPHLHTSLEWTTRATPSRDSAIIDIGAGQSTLVDDLLAAGYRNLTILDIASAALDRSRARLAASPLAEAASRVRWLAADIAQPDLPPHALPPATFDLWHDRAVFHFLTTPAQRQSYISRLAAALIPGGHLILATFGPDGPQKCSGLPAARYSADSLSAELGPQFTLQHSALIDHTTPAGATQQFLYCDFLRV